MTLDRQIISDNITKALQGVAKDLDRAFDRSEQELGLSRQLSRSITVSGNTATVQWSGAGGLDANQLHEGAVLNNGTRMEGNPWLDTISDDDVAAAFIKHYE
jgi:hypothetical protein